MDRKAAEELLHIKGWLDRVDELQEDRLHARGGGTARVGVDERDQRGTFTRN